MSDLLVLDLSGTDFASNFDAELRPVAIKRWRELGLLNPQTPTLEPADVARAVVFQLSQPDPVSLHHLTIRSRAN